MKLYITAWHGNRCMRCRMGWIYEIQSYLFFMSLSRIRLLLFNDMLVVFVCLFTLFLCFFSLVCLLMLLLPISLVLLFLSFLSVSLLVGFLAFLPLSLPPFLFLFSYTQSARPTFIPVSVSNTEYPPTILRILTPVITYIYLPTPFPPQPSYTFPHPHFTPHTTQHTTQQHNILVAS